MAVMTRTLLGRPGRGGPGRLRAVLQTPVVIVVACVAVLGAVTRPGATVVLGSVFGGLTWALFRHQHSDGGRDLPNLPHPAVAATGAVVVWAAVAGTATLGLPVVGILGALMAVPVAVAWWCRCPRPSAVPVRRDQQPGEDEAELVVLLRVLPVEDLFAEWRDNAQPWQPGAPEPHTRARLRCLLIAELGRRDPLGTRRWLLEAPDGPPDGYVTDRSERAA